MKALPMIHVPDVQATVRWYESIGFKVRAVHEEPGCPMDWAALLFGESEIMFSCGGTKSTAPRREMDLYLQVENLPEHFEHVRAMAEVIEEIHSTEYGMREFIIRDLNGFWITFGQPIAR